MAANRIYIQVDFQSSQADAQIKALNRNLADIGTTAQKSTTQAASGVKGFSVSMEQSSRAASDLSSALAGMAIVGFTTQMVKAADEINRVRISLETMTGSAATAGDIMSEIRRISQTQPFEFADLAAMTQRLKAFGFEAAQVPGYVEDISNAVSALGGGKVMIDSITLALGQMRAKGVVQGQELYRQLVETGVQGNKYLRKELAKELNREVSELDLRKMIEKGQVAGEKAVAVIRKGMREEYGGVGEEITKQLVSAQFTKLIDDMKKLAQVLNTELGPPLLSLIGWIRDLVRWFTQLDPAIKLVTVSIVALASAAAVLPSVFNFLAFVPANLKVVVGAFTAIRTSAIAAMATLALMRSGTMAGFNAWMGLAAGITAVGTAIAVVVAGFAGFKLGAWIRENIPEKGWFRSLMDKIPGIGLDDRDALRVIEKVNKENRAAANFLAGKLHDTLGKAGVKGYEKAPARPFASLTDAELTEEISRMKIQAAQISEERRLANEKLFKESTEQLEHQREIAKAALDNARQAYFKFTSDLSEKAGDLGNAIALAFKEIAYQHKALADQLKQPDEISFGMAKLSLLIKMATEELKIFAHVYAKNLIEEGAQSTKAATAEFEKHLAVLRKIEDAWRDIAQARIDYQIEEAQALKDLTLQEMGETPRQTYAQEAAFQRQSAQVQIEALNEVQRLRIEAINQRYQYELKQLMQSNIKFVQGEDGKMQILIKNVNEYNDQVEVLTQASQDQIQRIVLGTSRETLTIQSQMRQTMNERLLEDQRKAFESLKDAAGRVFDALLDKTTSVWKAIANIFKVTILTAIREIVTSNVARMLFQLFNPGQTVAVGANGQTTFGGAPAAGGGGRAVTPFDRIKQALGFVMPQYAPTSAVTPGYNPNAATVQSQGGSDREMGPDLYNLPTRASAGPGTLWGQISGAKGPSTTSQIRESFNIGKPIRTLNGSTIPWSAASPRQRMGSVLNSPGFAAMAATVGLPLAMAGFQRSGLMGDVLAVGGAAMAGYGIASMAGMAPLAGAAIGGGAALFARGLQRGGVKGLLMTTGGGAIAGAAISTQLGFGPVPGAIIGAAVGAVAGTIRLFIKNADEKVRDKVRSVYGVDIRDRAIRQQIVDIAKQNYGGNLDVAIRSREVMELVQLYSLVSGQQSQRMPRPMYPATFAQSGAGLQMQPVYSGGQLVSNPYTGTTTTQAMQPPPNMFIQLDPRQANDLFEGRVVNAVQNNPEAVAQSNASATRSGSSRIAQRSNLLEPLTVTS